MTLPCNLRNQETQHARWRLLWERDHSSVHDESVDPSVDTQMQEREK